MKRFPDEGIETHCLDQLLLLGGEPR